jgi:hypothetical protein
MLSIACCPGLRRLFWHCAGLKWARRRLQSGALSKGVDARLWLKSFACKLLSSDRAGTRTQDQRINVPHRLSPTNRRLRLEGTSPVVERLDYPTAISGVPRLVSGAEAGDPPVPCLLITQSPPFQTVTLAVTGDVVVAKALRASQHTAAFTRRGSVSSRARLLFQRSRSVEVRCSTD